MKNNIDIYGTGNVWYSHAPLLLEKVYKKRFLKGIKDNPKNLTQEEVRSKCLQVLGYLEEFHRIKGDKTEEEIKESQEIENLETEDDLFQFLLNSGQKTEGNKGLDLLKEDEEKTAENKGLDLLKEDNHTSEISTEVKKINTISAQRASITQKIRNLFSYKQVRKFFVQTLRNEAKKYEKARPKLDIVAKMEFAHYGAIRMMIKVYLDSKKSHGKLVQSANDKIANLEAMRKKTQEKEDVERDSANEMERGFLKAQQLLKYKNQIKEKGFALTPSRRALVQKISEHVLAGRKVFLVGPTGTGKTELAFYVADQVSGGYEVISWHEGTTPRDLFGYRELWTDENGNTFSGTKPGPVTKAVTEGKVGVHDEYTTGTTRAQLSAKAFMNARAGQEVHIPGFNGQVFEVSNSFAEIFTGNLKDERTKDREEMDPAILRMLTGLKIDYMPAGEMKDIILSTLIEDNGVLRLSLEEVKLIEKLCKASELMHMFHNREFKQIESVLGEDSDGLTFLKNAFGGDIQDVKLDNNFLDPGTLFSIFDGFDFSRAKHGNLKTHLESRLTDFLQDPKSDSSPEERILLRRILELTGVISSNEKIEVQLKENGIDRDYILPSELAMLSSNKRREDNPLEDEEDVGVSDYELSEYEKKWLVGFKGRFDKLKKELKHDVKWSDVEKTLRDNPEVMKKLMRLDKAGFEMSVFRSKNKDEIVFRSAQRDARKIAKECREIMYDKQAEIDNPRYKANGNAVDFARDFGVELADKELYEQLRLQNNTWMWLKTDDTTRKFGRAFVGGYDGIYKNYVDFHVALGSFCPALRVKKVKVKELSEEEKKWLVGFKVRFDELKKELKYGVEWSEVEKTLRADPEVMKKLMRLDKAGFEMNVFGSKNKDEIVFRTAQRDATKIAKGYREIMYDRQAEIDNPEYKANGNAVDLARDFGVELADKELYEQLRLQNNTWMWLKTDDATRKFGIAFNGSYLGIHKSYVNFLIDGGSFCPALRVKKS